ncbi:P-loop NTPase fold protein [Vibrio crassostreae]|uniref:P-loop NTPase fold protein n=1 Tax=Vibrio crassostreae TaxID=246167 RepID=UPI001B317536|nr:P-loop NTPase fold protein [Vibrio crassostreae]
MSQPSYITYSDPWFYHRPNLATHIGNMCKDTLFSRMVYLGTRRIGKSYFFLNDLSPYLIQEGLMPIYINMWGNKSAPHTEFAEQLAIALDELKQEGALKRFLNTEIKKLAIGNQFAKVEMEFKPKAATDIDLSNIKSQLKAIVEAAGSSKVILILDEFQHLSTSSAFDNFLYALRTLLDTYGSRISVIFTGSSRTGMKAAFEDDKVPFYQSAQVNEFPVIDDGFIAHCTDRLKSAYNIHINRLELLDFWHEIDHSPHWIINLMREMVANQRSLPQAITFIKEAIRVEEGHDEVLKNLTATDKAVLFLLHCKRGLYSEESMRIIKATGGKATKGSVQSSERRLENKKIISVLPDKSIIIELYGLIDSIKKELPEEVKSKIRD